MFFTILLIVITAFISYRGFKDAGFLDRYAFNIEKVRVYREYPRLVTSGFLHVNWIHLVVNMFVLWAFGSGLEKTVGLASYMLIFASSLVGGNVLAMWIHKHNEHYTSVGASGAIAGLIFATIALFPGMKIWFLPSWVFGIAYVIYTIYAIRSRRTDVGHAAQLGGALIGMLVSIMIYPDVLVHNWLPVLGILLPGIVLIIIMIRKPELILIDKKTQERQLNIEDKYNLRQRSRQQEIDRILEKINQKGIESLSRSERELLDEYSRS